MRFLFRIKTYNKSKGETMNEDTFNKYIEFHKNSNKENKTNKQQLAPIINIGYNIVELGNFQNYLLNFTLSYKVIQQIDGDISLVDILNSYKLKTLNNKDLQLINSIKLKNFKVICGKQTDLRFICFEISSLHLNYLNSVFKPYDRTYHRYKKEFTKFERSLLFKLKNNLEYESIHKDCSSWFEQLDLNGNVKELPFEEVYKNEKQTFTNEYEFIKKMKKARLEKAQKTRKMRATAIKALRLWKKLRMPRLPRPERKIKKGAVKTAPKLTNNGGLGYIDGRLVSFYKPECKKYKKQKIKPVERVFWIKPEDNHWFKKEEKHLW